MRLKDEVSDVVVSTIVGDLTFLVMLYFLSFIRSSNVKYNILKPIKLIGSVNLALRSFKVLERFSRERKNFKER